MKIFVISPIIESKVIKLETSQQFVNEIIKEQDVEVICSFLDTGPTSVENEIDDALSVPGLLVKASWAVTQGADGIVIDCMCDPGLKALRCALNIPVIGPAETAFHLAATLGHRFSVVDIGNDTGPTVEDMVKRYGLMGKFASIRGTGIPVEEIGDSNDKTTDALYDESLKAIEQDHADVIVLGCTGFSGTAKAVKAKLKSEKKYDVPVIDPLPLTIRTMISLLKETHGHSKKAFPTPVKKGLRGYNLPALYNTIQ